MAISPVYALRETGQNLWRNFMLSMATVITIGVSLWLFGGFFLFNYAVDNATQRWEGGIEFVVWMNPEATSEQNANILDAIMTSPGDSGLHVCRSGRGLRRVQGYFLRYARTGRGRHPGGDAAVVSRGSGRP